MDTETWDALPSTTNAEEAMHNKIYAAVGRKHTLMEGLRALYHFCTHYERLHEGAASMFCSFVI